ncbi:GTA-gp10 family protein [Aquidulcibacter sp.]|uniref:GTA-gp10 family protein n=1 Tax=Aquidulcibacter sp. TaxID=2052990 RepID=UPI0025B91EA6|nr:GTA-gp10 family protein [Aquidulcibacter sp.]MCA3695567.1 gene transfer agent family protein [Aquidulcibacter sp.]
MTGLINPARGEAVLHVDGRPLILCLTMGALARLEAAFEVNTLEALEARLATLCSHDVLVIISALLCGEAMSPADLAQAQIRPTEAAQAIAKAFEGAGA